MTLTVLYPEAMYPDLSVEHRLYGPEVKILKRDAQTLADLDPADCAGADGLMIFRQFVLAEDFARFPKLKAIVRMGVGYDRVDRKEAAARGVMVCNVPDYGTTEVADHAIALALALRRGLLLHHERQRATPPAAWTWIAHPLIKRASAQSFGILGLGRIGTATALRAKAFGFRVLAYDPYQPNGVELALGIDRARTLESFLRESDILSVHAPLTRETRGMIGAAELAALPRDAVVVNTARGPIMDLDALMEALERGHIAGAGLDVLPEEPPVPPIPALLASYQERAPWHEGRLIITPHSAFHTPEAWNDIRVKSAETMRAALLGPRPQNVIPPDAD
ncbi:MAG TPA: C-terminal binding protein [Acetobacteraceae bacterium]|nr:C-terminal binding protein [Acetobacteraceae bacterium]